MPPVRHLPNAPIREAVLDVRVDLPAEFSAAVFRELKERVGSAYPKMTEGTKVAASLQFNAAGAFSSESVDLGLHGVLFQAADDKTVAQFRTDGFTLNRLRPYTSWDSLFPEAMRLWALFAAAAPPSSVSKISLRYINEFQVPGTVQALSRYLNPVPAAVPGMLGRARGFLTRIVAEDEARQASIVTYSVIEQAGGRQTQIVFDIDVSCAAVGGTTESILAPLFGQLRTAKNAIFFESLSEETLALFQ